MPKKDINQIAFTVLQKATGEVVDPPSGKIQSGLGRARSLSADKRSEIAKKAALARWSAKPPSTLDEKKPPIQKKRIVP
jgi:hypothetical protein